MKKIHILLFLILLASCQQNERNTIENSKILTGDYYGQSIPKNLPLLFAPGEISTGLYERDFTISPDGNEIYFTIMGVNYSVIAFTRRVNGIWTKPAIAPFSGSRLYYDAEPHISPDGQKFLFLSTRPQKGQEPKSGWVYQDIWVMERINNEWSDPHNLGMPVNTEAGEYFPSMTRNGTLYFTREEEDGQHQAIYRSEWINGSFSDPEKLPENVNSTGFEYNACISPDEDYLILCNQPKEGKIGASDYSVSFRGVNGEWSNLINLGVPINLPGTQSISPYLSPDGKYFMFSSNRQEPIGDTLKNTISIQQLIDSRTKPKNGNSDIYWVNTSVIEALKPE